MKARAAFRKSKDGSNHDGVGTIPDQRPIKVTYLLWQRHIEMLERYQREKGQPKSWVIRKALDEYFQRNPLGP